MLANAAADVPLGSALVFPVTRAKDVVRLWISPIGVKGEKLRVIHDLTFSEGGAGVRKTRERREREATLETEGRSMNADKDWEKVPEYRLAEVMT